MEKIEPHIESLLFLKGEPMSARELSGILGVPEAEVKTALESLSDNLSGRGIMLVSTGDKFALATSPGSSEFTKKIIEDEFNSELSKASLEVLSIIVYKGPVSRAEVDYIRGVNSAFTVRNLLIRGLVEREINPRDSRSFLYKPSLQFMQYMGIKNLKELPEYESFGEKIKEFLSGKNEDNGEQADKLG